jgi:hypothetical protein
MTCIRWCLFLALLFKYGLGLDVHAQTANFKSMVPTLAHQAFFSRIVHLDPTVLGQAPAISQGHEGRTLWAAMDKVTVYGHFNPGTRWRIVRAPLPIQNPLTDEVLGYVAQDVGAAQWLSGNASTQQNEFQITQSNCEIQVGDLLIPEELSMLPMASSIAAAMPPTVSPVLSEAQVAYLENDRHFVGSLQMIILNQGTQHGLQAGHLVALWHQPWMESSTKGAAAMPNGRALIVHATERMAWALPTGTVWPIRKGDEVSHIRLP